MESVFSERYETPFFFSAPAYQDADFEIIEFDNIYRQDNQEFISLLNLIRSGDSSISVLEKINQRVIARARANPGTLTLAARNLTADRINEEELAKLPGTEFSYDGNIQGELPLSGDRLPAPEILRLKIGAQVMFTRNDPEQKRWVNGTLGTVHSLTQTRIQVKTEEGIYTLEPEKWEMIRYDATDDGAIIAKTVGTYKQYPITPAWAMTIHKAQGKTLERVIIDLDNGGAFAAGQLYVALSRCRSLENIALRRPATANDIRCDERVINFCRLAR
jgi:ATP-dependent exoDNAse (exonuclease V) alpha subunit